MRGRITAILALAGVAAVAAAPAGVGAIKKNATVQVYDNYYSPAKLTIRKGGTVKWVWPVDAGDVHDVKLKSGPKGAKGFWSQPGAAGYRFSRKLTVAGTYRIICTLHEEMKMTIVVKR